ncbi:MAG: hypothetical protein IPM66_09835 [Acidobacteriota bacterium]|nr:MAG: hypothetical protein IPM66_09835 [Acidobacteriota bacterium]
MPAWEIDQSYDGVNQPLKRVKTRRIETLVGGGPQTTITTVTETTLYVRSSLLGGQIVYELDESGNRRRANIYGIGGLLARGAMSGGTDEFRWRVGDPVTGNWGDTSAAGGYVDTAQIDPLGAEVGSSDPYLLNPDPTYPEMKDDEPLYIEGGDPFDLSGGCTLDGMPVPCSAVSRGIDSGSVVGQLTLNGRYIGGQRSLNSLGGMIYSPGLATGLTIRGEDGSIINSISQGFDELPFFVRATGLTTAGLRRTQIIGAISGDPPFGGGGGGQSNETEQLIAEAVGLAKLALKKPKCKQSIAGPAGRNPYELLNTLHKNKRLISGEVIGARAVTRPTIRQGRSFFGAQSTILFDKYIFSNSNEEGYRDVLKLTILLGTEDRNVARATLILHELSHATRKNDGAHSAFGGDSDKLNMEIHKVCFDGK